MENKIIQTVEKITTEWFNNLSFKELNDIFNTDVNTDEMFQILMYLDDKWSDMSICQKIDMYIENCENPNSFDELKDMLEKWFVNLPFVEIQRIFKSKLFGMGEEETENALDDVIERWVNLTMCEQTNLYLENV